MKKNFLLLFLMALLPLAGWADITITTDPTISAAVDYDGTAKQAITAAAVATSTNVPTIYYAVTSSTTAPAVDADDWQENYADATATNAGTYYVYVKVTDSEETLRQYIGEFVINKVDPTIVTAPVAVDDELTYNGTPQAIVATAPTTEDGTLTYSLTEGGTYTSAIPQPTDAGTYQLWYKVTGDSNHKTKTFSTAANFKTIAQKAFNVTGDFTVTRSATSVNYNGAAQTCPYVITYVEDDINQELTLDEDYTVTYVDGNTTVGAHAVTISAAGNFSGSFSTANLNALEDGLGTWTINQKPITVMALDQTKVYNASADLPSEAVDVAYQIIGVVGDENVGVPTLSVTDASANVGEYAVTPSNCNGVNAANYSINYVSATFTITPKSGLIITADNANKNKGAVDPELTISVEDNAGNDAEVNAIKAACQVERAEGETVGTYTITLTVDETADAIKNYSDITKNNGTFTINGGNVLITVLPKEKTYGEDDPEFTYILSNNDGNDLQTKPTLTRVEGETAGTYTITASGAVAPEGYEGVDYVEGTLTIKKAPLTVTLPVQNVDAGLTTAQALAALDATDITITGWVNSDAPADIADAYELTLKDGLTQEAGVLTNQTAADGYILTLDATYFANYGIGNGLTETTSGKLVVGTGAVSDIAFTSVDADYATIVAHAGETQNVTLKITPRNSREVPAGTVHTWAAQTWQTMVLPFEVSVADLSQALGYAIVNRVDAENTAEGNVQFKLEMDKIPANEPFCVKTSKALADDYVATFPNAVKIVAPASEYPSVDAGMGYKFVGAYKAMIITNENPTYSFLRGDNAKWARITNPTSTNTWEVVPFDAYIDLTGADASREITFTFQELDGSTTAIKAVEASVDSTNGVKEGWYNLSGMKLEGAPTQKGVYINNGKKVVIK